ncbi:MAG: serine/threonine-protein kinase [Gemmataceae bacterium]|nr:serine/threonine-protein kinase [Gemmataceae bacterium]
MIPANSKPSIAAATLLDQAFELGLLDANQRDELLRASVTADAVALGNELARRGWLTHYQIHELLQGRGAELLLGQYCLLEPLGGGGMGQVYKAWHRLMGRVVALKVIRSDLLSRPEAVQRFQREIKLAAKLNHPHIVTAHDAEKFGERHCLVMEYCEGKTLAELVRQTGALPVGQACAYVQQAALGLQHAHERDLIHRDIKPENLLLSRGVVKILDFGLARLRVPIGPDDKLTRLGTVMGTPDFMAPEQARDLQTADARSDLYSLGCTFYFLLTGRVPFLGGTAAEKMLRQQVEEPPPLARFRGDVPVEVRHIVSRLMAKEPQQRYQTAGELAAVLAPLAQHESAAIETPAEIGENAPTAGWSSAPIATYQTRLPNDARAIAAQPSPAPPTPLLPKGDGKDGAEMAAGIAKWRWAAIAGGTILLVVFAFWLVIGLPDPSPKPPDPKTPEPKQLTLNWREGPSAKLAKSVESTKSLEVRNLAISPDGRWLALAIAYPSEPETKGEIQLWEANAAKLIHRNSWPLKYSATCVAFSKDSQELAYSGVGSAAEPAPITIRKAANGEEIHKLKGNKLGISCLALSAKGLLFAGNRDKTISIWEFLSAKFVQTVIGPNNSIKFLALSADGQTLICDSGDSVFVWDVAGKPQKLHQLKPLPTINALAIAGDGKTIAVALAKGKDTPPGIKLWDASTGEPGAKWLQEGRMTHALAFTPDGTALVSAHDNMIGVWDLKNDERVELTGHIGAIPGLALSADGLVLASADVNGTLRLWLRTKK